MSHDASESCLAPVEYSPTLDPPLVPHLRDPYPPSRRAIANSNVVKVADAPNRSSQQDPTAGDASADIDFHGVRLWKGEKIMLMFESANFDETVFGDRDNFCIERTSDNHLAFGFGTHFFLGNQLARLELSIMTKRLLQRLPDLHLAYNPEAPLRAANFITGPQSMPVGFTPTSAVPTAKTTHMRKFDEHRPSLSAARRASVAS